MGGGIEYDERNVVNMIENWIVWASKVWKRVVFTDRLAPVDDVDMCYELMKIRCSDAIMLRL